MKKTEGIIRGLLLFAISAIYLAFILYNTISETKTTQNVEVMIESCEKVRAKNNDKNTLIATTEYITVVNYKGITYRLSDRWAYNECVGSINKKANATFATIIYPNGRTETYIEHLKVLGD